MAEASGSLWNVNSWHWENKNYTEVAKNIITYKILSCDIVSDDINVRFTKVASIKGDAQINVRKGKQIICFGFKVEVEWKGTFKEHQASGSFKISDLNESDMDFEITSINANEKTPISDDCKSILKKKTKKELENAFITLKDELMVMEADPKKLEQDKIKREQAIVETKKAKEEKGAEKERLLEEQKLKEKQLKEANNK